MKKSFVRRVLLVVALFGIMLSLGCATDQPGETMAEGHRRHKRVLRINSQGFWSDLDTLFLTDKPSTLTDMRLP